MSATPTDAEHKMGSEISHNWRMNRTNTFLGEATAQALADQRARYEAVADELDDEATRDAAIDRFQRSANARRAAADRIRQVTA